MPILYLSPEFELLNVLIKIEINAGIAQLVERNLAKVDVAGSSPVSRSNPDKVGIIFWRRCQVVQGEGLQNLYSSVRI